MEHLVPLVKNGAVDFIEGDQVKEAGRKLLEAPAQRLQRDDVEAVRRIDLVGVDARARLVRDESLKSLGLGLFHQCVPVGDEQDPPRLVGAQEDIYQ